MPVESHSHSGVCTVMAGSRMAARGITSLWLSNSLTLVFWLVTPAPALNSPPAMVVGTLIWRTTGAFIGGGTPPLPPPAATAPAPDDIVGEANLPGFGAMGDRPAAHRHDDIGIGGASLAGGFDHRLAWRMR